MLDQYDTDFFNDIALTSGQSATRIAPWLIGVARPSSVLDFGCGEGVWLAAFKELGIADVFGIDGDYVDTRRLKVSLDNFKSADLSKPIALGRSFDLAICLEVAEHLCCESADVLVTSLVNHSPVILFSAAIPLQQGTDHRNEQWPSYWMSKFAEHGYTLLDVVRPKFWEDEAVAVWYRQNAFILAKDGHPYGDKILRAFANSESFQGKPLVHPALWIYRNGIGATRVGELAGPRELLAKLPSSSIRAISRRVRGVSRESKQ